MMRAAEIGRSESTGLPVLMEPGSDPVDLVSWIRLNRSHITHVLRTTGAILFRNFGAGDEAGLAAVIRAACGCSPLDYVYRSSPRQGLGHGIYTSTEYPAKQAIPLHHENAYAADWPMKIFFCCIKTAERGGETPLADGRKVLRDIHPDVRGKFERLGVRYTRNHGRLDLPWQEVYQTDSREEVERCCEAHGIQFEWKRSGGLRTNQICQAVARHPITHEAVWFNQAHLFHVSALGPRIEDTLRKSCGEDELPRQASYGDGTPLEAAALADIRKAYDRNTVRFEWQTGDVLMLDNMLVAHGRAPFTGQRRVVVGMAEPYSTLGARERER